MLRTSTKLLTTLSASLVLASCAAIRKPEVLVGITNAPARNVKYYRMDKDFDEELKLKPGAKPIYRPFDRPEDLNKHLCFTTPEDGPEEAVARVLAYLRKLKDEYDKGCKAQPR